MIKRQNDNCSNSHNDVPHNDVPQVAQRNVFIVAHTRHRCPSLDDTVEANPPYIVSTVLPGLLETTVKEIKPHTHAHEILSKI